MSDTFHNAIIQPLQDAGIKLVVTRKRVKNINFRLKPYKLNVSAPTYASDDHIIKAINQRVSWALRQHEQILKRQQAKPIPSTKGSSKLVLWGEPQAKVVTEAERIVCYRQELTEVMPTLFVKWQPIVGKVATETRIKKMTTRWGSCNTRAKRVWLSVYLPAYPLECTEYVIVHELCHLHYANHSAEFWDEVKRSMPNYKHWHDMLKGKPTGKNQDKIPDID